MSFYLRQCYSYMAQSAHEFSYKDLAYTFVDCQRKLLEELSCPICLQLVSNPVQTSCGHLFCRKCIVWKTTCPVDRKNFSSTPDHFNNRRLGSFKVKCPNFERGCNWIGELRRAERHTSEVCEYQMTPCPNGCGQQMEQRRLQAHKTAECHFRNYKCRHCP